MYCNEGKTRRSKASIGDVISPGDKRKHYEISKSTLKSRISHLTKCKSIGQGREENRGQTKARLS
jgi:predicted RNA-binding protein (virulence factor B family)